MASSKLGNWPVGIEATCFTCPDVAIFGTSPVALSGRMGTSVEPIV
jgi:hypothetical protein